jgi:hypothetical protein
VTAEEPAPIDIDWDARFEAQMAAYRAKQTRKAEVRKEFAEARAAGLRQRHAQKLSRLRNQRESTEPEEEES